MYAMQEDTPFKIGLASFQEWVAGVKGGGSGINVVINITNIQEGVTIKNIYFRNKIEKAQNNVNNIDQFKGAFKTESNRDINMDSNPVKEAQNTPPKQFPFSLKENEAVVSYELKGELYFTKVSEMTKKPLLAYPSAGPNDEN